MAQLCSCLRSGALWKKFLSSWQYKSLWNYMGSLLCPRTVRSVHEISSQFLRYLKWLGETYQIWDYWLNHERKRLAWDYFEKNRNTFTHTCCPAVISRFCPPPKNFFWVYPPPYRSKIRLTRLDTNFLAPALLNPAGGIFPAKDRQKPFLFSNSAFF